MGIKDLLELTVQRQASDLHLINGLPPFIRVEGVLSPVDSGSILTAEIIGRFIKEILPADNFERFLVNKELDFSLAFSQKARFRVNAYTQKATPAISFRMIPLEINDIDSLNLPKILHSFTTLRQGFTITNPLARFRWR